MAETTFNTRILLKYDSYSNWTTNNPTLKAGEMALAYITSGNTQEVNSVTAPQILIKVGDGTSDYNSLPFVSARAADVYAWAKADKKPTYEATEIGGLEAYIGQKIQDTDTQYKIVKVNDYQYKLMSKAKADTEYATEVAVIDIPNDTTTIQANADAIDALEALVGNTAVATQISDAITALNLAGTYETKADASAKLAEAKKHATDLNTSMNSRVETLESKFGNGEGTVEAQISAAVAAETSARETAISGLQSQIDSNDTDISDLKGLVGTTAVSAQITAVTDPLAGRLATIEGDYLKAEDKTELQGAISDAEESAVNRVLGYLAEDTVNTNFDTLKEIAAWIESDTTSSAQLVTRVSDAEGEIDTLQSDVEALEGLVGTTKVSDQISTAITNLDLANTYDAKGAAAGVQSKLDEEIARAKAAESANATAAANAATAASNAQSDVDALESKVDAIRIDTLSQTAGTTLIFDCGNSVI